MRSSLNLALVAGLAFGSIACSGGASPTTDAGKSTTEVQAEAKAADVPTLQKIVANYNTEIASRQDQVKELEGKVKDAVAKALGGSKGDVDKLKADLDKLVAQVKDLKDRLEIYAKELAARAK